MDPSIDVGVVYGACRERIGELVRGLGPGDDERTVPACPDWTVHDLVAHLAGLVTDVNAGRLEGLGTDPWTAAQVEARRDVPVADLLDEWNRGAAQFEEGLRSLGGPFACLGIADVWNHEQDLRDALGIDGGEDPAAELCAIEGYLVVRQGGGFAAAGLAPLKCAAGAHVVVSAEGEPGATLSAEPFEIARAITERRTREQLESYHWEGDAAPYVAALARPGPALSR